MELEIGDHHSDKVIYGEKVLYLIATPSLVSRVMTTINPKNRTHQP